MSNWRANLKIFSDIPEAEKYIINKNVDTYLLSMGFYEATLNPRFMNGESDFSKIKNLKSDCLRLDCDDPRDSDNIMRIFVTKNELYMETQTSYRSFNRSYYRYFSNSLENVSVDTIDSILDIVSIS